MEKIIKKNKLYESGNLKCNIVWKKKNFSILDESGKEVALIRTYKNNDMQKAPSAILKFNDMLYSPEFDKTTNQEIMKIFSDICRENNLRVTTICTGKGKLGLVADYIYYYPKDEKYTKSFVSEEIPANIKGEYFLISNNESSTPFIVSKEQRDLMVEHDINIFAFAPKFLPYSTNEHTHETVIPYLQKPVNRNNYITLDSPDDMKNTTIVDDFNYLSNVSEYNLYLSNNYDMKGTLPITLPVLKTDNNPKLRKLNIDTHAIRDKENPYIKTGGNIPMMRDGVFDFSKNDGFNISKVNFGYFDYSKNVYVEEKEYLKNISESLKTLNDNSSVIFSGIGNLDDLLWTDRSKEELMNVLNEKIKKIEFKPQ